MEQSKFFTHNIKSFTISKPDIPLNTYIYKSLITRGGMMKKKMICIMFVLMLMVVSGNLFANGQEEVAKADDNEPVVIEWLAYNTHGEPDKNSPIIKYFEEKYNCEFKFWVVDDKEWEQSLAVRFASGDMPDFMKIRPVSNVAKYVEQGILAPITDEMMAQLPAYKEVMAKHDPEETWKTEVTVDDQIYALRKFNLNGAYPTVMVWRTDWLRNVGINKIPETLEEFEEAMYKFTFDDPDGNGKDDTYGISETGLHYVMGAFGYYGIERFFGDGRRPPIFIKNGKYEFAAVQPEMKEALTLLNKWYKAGVIDPEFITGENKGGYWAMSHSFMNGRIGVTGKVMAAHWKPALYEGDTPSGVLKEFLKVNPGLEYGRDVKIGNSPVGPTGAAGGSTWGALGEGFGFSVEAVKKPRVVETVLAILNDNLSDLDQYIIATGGFENTHYTIDSQGSRVSAEGFQSNAERVTAGISVLNGGMQKPEFDKKSHPLRYAFNDETKNHGYLPYPVIVSEEYNQYIGDLQKLSLETYMKIIIGDMPISEFDNYVDIFYERGGRAILDKLNK